jgi:serine/threonine-protein kinase
VSNASALSEDPVAAALSRALGAQYELRRLLGRGGMGAVYLAYEPFLERSVAVKVLTAEIGSHDARDRFLREARTAARLSHPHIVPLYTFGHVDDLPYYVMGYVDGESLESRLERQGRLDAEDARRVLRELADALDYAHQSGVVHRDVKPDNVLLDRITGRAMLTDFGVAKQWTGADALTTTGIIVGTPQYMSPEQASGERNIDGRSDVYSLGVVAYRMVTGRLPFEGETFREVMVQHATKAPVPASRVVESLPLDLDAAISRALAKAPEDRWLSARQMSDALAAGNEEAVPEELHGFTGIGVSVGLASLLMGEVALLGGLTGFLEPGAVVAASVGVIAGPLIAGLGAISAARRFGWGRVLRQACRQPGAWSSWWPRPWRRPGDVWDRLPPEILWIRAANGMSIAVALPLFNAIALGMTEATRGGGSSLLRVSMAAYFALIVPVLGGLYWLSRGLRRRAKEAGLTKVEATRLWAEPTWNLSFWSKPHIAALLEDAPEGERSRRWDSDPEDLLREIDRYAREGAASPHADVYAEAGDAARAIVATISEWDRELALLARDADPRELARIEASIAALGAPGDDERTAKGKMRELLHGQLQIFIDITQRQKDLAEMRAHLHEQLRTLLMQLARLRASDHDASESSEISGRIRALVSEIEVRVEAAAAVRRLTSSA